MTDRTGLCVSLGYSFRNGKLLEKALTHTSYANEHSGQEHRDSNQRLEFLGDSVLSTIVSTYIYRRFPELPEGRLSRLRAEVVCEDALAQVAAKLELGEYLLLGKGELAGGGAGKPSILADAVEALIAAVYLDSDLETCSGVVLEKLDFAGRISGAIASYRYTDHKTVLQERFPGQFDKVAYEIVSVSGPQHQPVFRARATVLRGGKTVYSAEGYGRSKKDAEQDAAGHILEACSGGDGGNDESRAVTNEEM